MPVYSVTRNEKTTVWRQYEYRVTAKDTSEIEEIIAAGREDDVKKVDGCPETEELVESEIVKIEKEED
jgi:hypothetical protein